MEVIAIKGIRFIVAAVALVLSGNYATADWVGSQGFADIGAPALAPGNDILKATSFKIGYLVSNGSNTGVFSGLTPQFLGSVTIDTSKPSISFGNAVMGYFSATNIFQETKTAGLSGSANTVDFVIDGTYTGGSYVGSGSISATLQVTFNQQGAGKAISDSATLIIPDPPHGTPEPTSIALLLAAAPCLILVRRFRRKQAAI